MSAVYDSISRLLYERGIDLFAPIKLSDCKITKKYLLNRTSVSESDGRAIMLAVPYLANDSACGNISEYAKSREYHLFFESLFNELLPVLRRDFPSLKFEGGPNGSSFFSRISWLSLWESWHGVSRD